MSMSHSPWAAMRSLTRDGEVAKRKLAPGTVPRIARFARPYRRQIAMFLVLVVIDAVLIVALPLLFKVIVDEVADPRVATSRSSSGSPSRWPASPSSTPC